MEFCFDNDIVKFIFFIRAFFEQKFSKAKILLETREDFGSERKSVR